MSPSTSPRPSDPSSARPSASTFSPGEKARRISPLRALFTFRVAQHLPLRECSQVFLDSRPRRGERVASGARRVRGGCPSEARLHAPCPPRVAEVGARQLRIGPPFQGLWFEPLSNPGRWPGLCWIGPSGLSRAYLVFDNPPRGGMLSACTPHGKSKLENRNSKLEKRKGEGQVTRSRNSKLENRNSKL